MSSTVQTIDQDRLDAFLGRFVADLGAAMSAALVVIGDRLGLYRAMADGQLVSAAELAARTGTDPRYVQEWLANQAAGGYVSYDPEAGEFFLAPEQALALAQEGSPADVGCGHGASTLLMAEAFPRSEFVGFDYHEASIEHARRAAEQAGLGDRVRFEVSSAKEYPGDGYDLVCMFDCLHDMGDPVGAAAHVHRSLAADGTWLIVEPYAGDRLEDNLNPVGRVFYGASTLVCTPASRDQEVGLALGAQAGEARLGEVVRAGGFTRFRRATETAFNLVLEARP